MNRTSYVVIFVAVLGVVLLTWFVSRYNSGDVNLQGNYPIEKTLRYSFTLKNTSGSVIKESNFSAFAPVKQTATQSVISLEASEAFDLKNDRHGNQLMNFMIDAVPPYGTKLITITVLLGMSAAPNSFYSGSESYLSNSMSVNFDHPSIVAEAKRIYEVDPKNTGLATYNWVSQHVEYTGFDPVDHGALYALEKAKGDCTEYSYLTASILRQLDIPAKVVGGFSLSENQKVLRASDYHNWNEYFHDGTWRLSDAQKRIHDDGYENYIAFRIIEDDGVGSMSNSHRFLAFDQRLNVSMN